LVPTSGSQEPVKADAFAAAGPAAGAKSAPFNPAADLLPILDWLDPLTYQTQNPKLLPYRQASEREIVGKVQSEHTPEMTAAAEKLSDGGMGPMWFDYAAQYAREFGPAKGKAVMALLNAVLDVDGSAYLEEKKKFHEPRPFQIGHSKVGDSYPSGHTATAYAAATVLARMWPARAAEFYQAAANVARSRVYLDMHFAGDVAAGSRLGVAVANQVMQQVFQQVNTASAGSLR
jgi:undecaprenyl-diphosphatase